MRQNSAALSFKLHRVLPLGLILLCASGSAIWGQTEGKEKPKVSAPAEPAANPADAKVASDAVKDPQSDVAAYKLLLQDKIKYSIEEDPVRDADFPELIVTSLGFLNFPVSRMKGSPIVSVQAVGKTLGQIKAEVTAKLEEEFYHKATVSLQLTSKSERFGQVKFVGNSIKGMLKLNPGERKTLSEAIVEKGYTEYANLRRVLVLRQQEGSAKAKKIVVDIDSVLRKGRKDLDLILEDGDTVDVPEKGLVF